MLWGILSKAEKCNWSNSFSPIYKVLSLILWVSDFTFMQKMWTCSPSMRREPCQSACSPKPPSSRSKNQTENYACYSSEIKADKENQNNNNNNNILSNLKCSKFRITNPGQLIIKTQVTFKLGAISFDYCLFAD